MIVLDLETSGIDTGRCGIWQIGAIELENTENYFSEESRIDDGDFIERGALRVIGKTEEELRDKSKQSQKQLILRFVEWAKTCRNKIIVGQNIGWDLNLLQNRCSRYGVYREFSEVLGFKGVDLYAVAQMKHLEINGAYKMNETGRGSFSLTQVLEFCGIPDTRILADREGNIIKEGEFHESVEDCLLEGECFSRLVYGKNLFKKYSKFKIPSYLKK